MPASILDVITHYQKSIEKSAHDEARLLHCIEKLYRLPVTVEHLQSTGVGKTVNSLRKYEKEVGVAAKALVSKWKAMVAAEEKDPESDQEMYRTSYYENETGNGNTRSSIAISSHSSSSKSHNRNSSNSSGSSSNNSTVQDHIKKEEFENGRSINSRNDYDKKEHHKRVKVNEECVLKYKARKISDENKYEPREVDEYVPEMKKEIKQEKQISNDEESSTEYDDEAEKLVIDIKVKPELDSEENDSENSENVETTSKHHINLKKVNDSKVHNEKLDKSKLNRESNDKHRKDRTSHHSSKSKHRDEKKSNSKEKDLNYTSTHRSKDETNFKNHKGKRRDKEKDRDKKEDRHKSSSSSGSSNKSNCKRKMIEDVECKPSSSSPKTKVSKVIDEGIDSSMGTSFEEALGLLSSSPGTKIIPKNKPKTTSNGTEDNFVKPSCSNITPKSNTPDLLTPSAKLTPLDPIIALDLPTISPNYKPMPLNPTVMECVFNNKYLPPRRTISDEEALAAGISSKTIRTKVYSGSRPGQQFQVPSLFDLCTWVLQKNIDGLEYTGGVPFDVIKSVLELATPIQLQNIEEYNPYLMEDTDILWERICARHCRGVKRQEMETWRELYTRCENEREERLSVLKKNIKQSQKQIMLPLKKTQLAYVDSMVKPPRSVIRKQEQFGTSNKKATTPAARVPALSNLAPNIAKASDHRVRINGNERDTAQASFHTRPKKAPLMQKTLQFMKGRFKR